MKSPTRWILAVTACTVLTAVLATVALVLASPALAAEGATAASALDPSILRWGFTAAAAFGGLSALGAGYVGGASRHRGASSASGKARISSPGAVDGSSPPRARVLTAGSSAFLFPHPPGLYLVMVLSNFREQI